MHPADYIINALRGRKIIILGFGKEGVSSYLFLRKHFPDMPITVIDFDPESSPLNRENRIRLALALPAFPNPD